MHKHRLKQKRKYLKHFQTNSTQLSGNWIMEHGSLTVDQEVRENLPEYSKDSPSSGMFKDTKTGSTSSHKRRSLQKRVVSVPVKEIGKFRLKSEVNAPPSDSWAWRKYGQKPIKGSPYPRGYYRCSSSKGCPARKQVERNRADPTMVIVTYSCDHNHPLVSRHNNKNHHKNSTMSPPATSTPTTQEEVSNIDDQEEDSPQLRKQSIVEPEFSNLEVATDQLGWFSDLESLSSTTLESPLLARDIVCDVDMAMILSLNEEDESLFADLDELPECATVFRRREVIKRRSTTGGRALWPRCVRQKGDVYDLCLEKLKIPKEKKIKS